MAIDVRTYKIYIHMASYVGNNVMVLEFGQDIWLLEFCIHRIPLRRAHLIGCRDNVAAESIKHLIFLMMYVGSLAATEALFGPGMGPIFFDGIMCMGNESTILECNSQVHDCDHSQDAGVICASEQPCLKYNMRWHTIRVFTSSFIQEMVDVNKAVFGWWVGPQTGRVVWRSAS